MFMVFTMIAFFMVCKSVLLRLLYVGFIIYLSLITSCRTSIVAVALYGILILSIKIVKDKKKKVILYMGFIIAAIVYLLNKNIVLTNIRLQIWKNVVYNIFLSGFLGVGVGRGQEVNAINVLYTALQTGRGAISGIHNYFLELLLEVGIIGVAILCIWIFSIMKIVWKMHASDEGINYFVFAVMFLLTSFCVSTMTDYFQYWLFLGLIISYAREEDRKFIIISEGDL